MSVYASSFLFLWLSCLFNLPERKQENESMWRKKLVSLYPTHVMYSPWVPQDFAGSFCWPWGPYDGGSTGAERRTWTGTLTSDGPPPDDGGDRMSERKQRKEQNDTPYRYANCPQSELWHAIHQINMPSTLVKQHYSFQVKTMQTWLQTTRKLQRI